MQHDPLVISKAQRFTDKEFADFVINELRRIRESISRVAAAKANLEPVHVSISDGCAYTGESRTRMYCAVAKGKVRAVKEGGRTLLVFEDLKKRVAERQPAVIGVPDEKAEEIRFRKLRELMLAKHKHKRVKLIVGKKRGRPRKSDYARVEA